MDAFECLFRRYQSDIYGWIVRVVRDPATAEDLTVETLWRVYSRRYRFDPRRPFAPWARRIALRVAIDHLRKRDRWLPPPAAERSSDHDPVERNELRGAIREAFGRLPVRLRVAAVLALIERLPRREIADVLDISLSAVKMRVARALRMLRKSLERKGFRP